MRRPFAKVLAATLAPLVLVACSSLGAPPSIAPSSAAPPSAAQTATAIDPRATRCGVPGLAPVLGMFAVAHGAEVRQHIPNMHKAPELDSDEPAFVVLFDGPVDLPFTGAPPGPSGPATGVICVVVGDEPLFYVNVATTDWRD